MFAWIKKWWLAIVGVLAAGFALVARLFPRRSNKHLIERTKAEAERIKVSAAAEIKRYDEESERKIKEIMHISQIKEDRERLQKLADLANKKGNP